MLKVLREYRDVVAASFSGHAHKGGYRRDEKSGVHFRVFEAVLENPQPHNTYAIVSVYADRLEIDGFGNCQSDVYALDHNYLDVMAVPTSSATKAPVAVTVMGSSNYSSTRTSI